MNRPPGFNPAGAGRGVQAVTRLDTNTGPRADGNDFGAGGYYAIGQGLTQLGAGLMHAGAHVKHQKEERDRIEEEIWSTRTEIETRKHWAQRLHDAETSGQILDPATLEQEFQQDMLTRLESAPSERARMAAEKRLLGFGLNLYEQGLQQQAKFNHARRVNELETTFRDFTQMGATAEEAHASMAAFAEQFRGTAYEPTVNKLFQAHEEKLAERQLVEALNTVGAEQAAQLVRDGTYMPHLDPLRRLSMAENLAEKARAEKAVQAQIAAQEGLQQIGETFSAETQLTPEAIFEREQKAAQILASIRPGLSDADYQKQANEITRRTAIDLMQTASRADLLGLQKLYQQRYRYNPEDPTFKFINDQITRRMEQLDPLSKDYDPAALVNENPYISQELQQARFKLATNPQDPDAIAAANAAIQQSITLQRARGVPQGAERLMTNEDVRSAVAALTKANNKPEQWKAIAAAFPPEYHGRIAAEIAAHPDLPPATRFALRAPDNELLWKAGNFDMRKADKDLLKDISTRLINNKHFEALLAMTGDQSLRDAAIQAAYFATQPESGSPLSPSDAVKYVMRKVVQEKVSITESGGRAIAIPKTIARDNTQAAEVIKGLDTLLDRQLMENSVGIALPETQFRDGDNREAVFRRYLHHVRVNGEWEMTEDGSGFRRLVRDDNGQYAYVMGRDGKPLVWAPTTVNQIALGGELAGRAVVEEDDIIPSAIGDEHSPTTRAASPPRFKPLQILTYTPDELRAERLAQAASQPQLQPTTQPEPDVDPMKTRAATPAQSTTPITQPGVAPAPRKLTATQPGQIERARPLRSATRIGDKTLDYIMEFEGQFTKDGKLRVYQPPANDGGGAYEIAGINARYHPKMAAQLKKLIETGKHDEAYKTAAKYIKDYTDTSPAVRAAQNPGVQAYLRDSAFNRGPTGAVKILQIALGQKPTGRMTDATRAALAQAEKTPREFLPKLRQAREQYEIQVAGKRANLWRGLTRRWNDALTLALDLA